MTNWLSARHLLAVRLDNSGDVIMLGPALRAVKESLPRVRLTLLASPAGTMAARLLPWIDEVITWRSIWQDVGQHMPFDPAYEMKLINLLASQGIEGALIFTSFKQTPHVPGYVCYLAGIPLRAGESKEFAGSTLTTELSGAPDELHQVERNLRLVEHLGYTVRERRLAVVIPDSARLEAAALLAGAGIDLCTPFILLHPGASAKARRYPAAQYGTLARLLTRRGWEVVVTGVDREAALIEEVYERAPKVHRLVGSASLPAYAALVERARLVICNDTLPMHLADAVRTPVVVLFSGTDLEEQWRPRTTRARLLRRPTSCHPCYLFECPIGLPCLDIPAEEVVETVEELLDAGEPARVQGQASGIGGSK
jgi:ADP-heptose:LPS heptosyltransferase